MKSLCEIEKGEICWRGSERQCAGFWDAGSEVQFDHLSQPPVVLVGLGGLKAAEFQKRVEGSRGKTRVTDVSFLHLKPKVRK